jgi:hypothetical protein
MSSKYQKPYTIPDGFQELLKGFTREVLRNQVRDAADVLAIVFILSSMQSQQPSLLALGSTCLSCRVPGMARAEIQPCQQHGGSASPTYACYQ